MLHAQLNSRMILYVLMLNPCAAIILYRQFYDYTIWILHLFEQSLCMRQEFHVLMQKTSNMIDTFVAASDSENVTKVSRHTGRKSSAGGLLWSIAQKVPFCCSRRRPSHFDLRQRSSDMGCQVMEHHKEKGLSMQ